MKSLSPSEVLGRVADVIPQDCLEQLVVVGSLAAGYQLLQDVDSCAMRTKDVDCVLAPRVAAAGAGALIGRRLLEREWRPLTGDRWAVPGDEDTPAEELPAIRLRPPGDEEWFMELLTVPDDPSVREKQWLRVRLPSGHFGIPSFGFLALACHDPLTMPLGVRVARVEMMVLANLLEHRTIGAQTMSGLIEGRSIKRANKDLGRVLAIARLSNADQIEMWPERWVEALCALYPDDWRELAARAGDGLRALFASPEDLEEAHHTCIVGLLAATAVTIRQLEAAGQRLLVDAIEPLGATAVG